MANSTKRQSGAKSRPTIPAIPALSPRRKPPFPLWLHEATGQWCKKIRGHKRYFGTDKDAALKEYLRIKDDREAGREPPAPDDERVTVKRLGDSFCTRKQSQLRLGELTQTSFNNYRRSCQLLADYFGKKKPVESLTPEDLLRYRRKLAETRGVHALGNEITRVRVVLRFAFEAGMIKTPLRFGEFKRPKKSAFRRQRASVGSRIIEAPQLWKIINAADVQMRAMILLALNCGFGNSDCGQLPIDAVDLQAGWIEFARPKTGIERRCPLWPETIKALSTWLTLRRGKGDAFPHLAFITKYGQPWYRDGDNSNPISAEFRKLLDKLKLYRRGQSFYALRHCFQTASDELGDYIATRRILGHADHSIGDTYRERFPDERLRRVVNHVHSWLYPRPTVLVGAEGIQ